MPSISMRPTVLAAALVASTLSAFSETPKAATNLDPVCPVQLTQLRVEHNKLFFTNKNTSGVYIKKIAVGAAYYDSSNALHRIDVQGGWKDLHAGFVLDSALDIKSYRKTGYSGWAIWPEKVLFSDGSLWQINHSTTGCALQTTKTNQAENTPVPAEFLIASASTGGN